MLVEVANVVDAGWDGACLLVGPIDIASVGPV